MIDKKENLKLIGIIALLVFALNQQTKIGTTSLSVMDLILPSATGLEKMVVWWLAIAIISVILILSFFRKGG